MHHYISYIYKITMSVKLEIIIVPNFVTIFLEHMNVCANLDMSCWMMGTFVKVRMWIVNS